MDEMVAMPEVEMFGFTVECLRSSASSGLMGNLPLIALNR